MFNSSTFPSWQNMSIVGLDPSSLTSSSLEFNDHETLHHQSSPYSYLHQHHPHHHHPTSHPQIYHQPSDLFQSAYSSCDHSKFDHLTQLSLDQQHQHQQQPSDQLITHEFQFPSHHHHLFTNQPLTRLSPRPSSCQSSSSTNPSPFNNHHSQHPLFSPRDHHSPTPLHQQPYLANSLELAGQQFSSPGNSLLSTCPSRQSRRGSISSSASNSSWQVPKNISFPDASFDIFRWDEDQPEPLWGIPKYGDELEHERRRGSEGKSVDRADSGFGGQLADYLDRSRTATEFKSSLAHETNMSAWSSEGDSLTASSPGDGSPFHLTCPSFDLVETLPSHSNDQAVSFPTTEGPVMASFFLPPPDHPLHQATERHTQNGSTSLLSDGLLASSPPISQLTTTGITSAKLKKLPTAIKPPRAGNNGGRCRRRAPATRECPRCGDKFTRNDRLNYHIDSVHDHKEPQFKCTEPKCSKAFRQKSDLVRHLRFVHQKR